mgnify:CR=1 FL=1
MARCLIMTSIHFRHCDRFLPKNDNFWIKKTLTFLNFGLDLSPLECNGSDGNACSCKIGLSWSIDWYATAVGGVTLPLLQSEGCPSTTSSPEVFSLDGADWIGVNSGGMSDSETGSRSQILFGLLAASGSVAGVWPLVDLEVDCWWDDFGGVNGGGVWGGVTCGVCWRHNKTSYKDKKWMRHWYFHCYVLV